MRHEFESVLTGEQRLTHLRRLEVQTQGRKVAGATIESESTARAEREVERNGGTVAPDVA